MSSPCSSLPWRSASACADDEPRPARSWRAGDRALRPLFDGPIQTAEGRRRRVQAPDAHSRFHCLVHSRCARQHLRVSVCLRESPDCKMGPADESGRRLVLHQLAPGAVLDCSLVDRLALRPCLVARQARDARLAETVPQEQETPSDAIDFFSVATILRSLILFNLLFAVQNGSRRDLSLGERNTSGRHQLCRLCASRRLSPDPHGVTGCRVRAGGHEPRRPGRAFQGDPPTGLSVGGAERAPRRILHSAARSLCTNLPADLVADCGLHLDAAGCTRASPDRRPHRAESFERLAGPRQPHHPDGHALYLFAGRISPL